MINKIGALSACAIMAATCAAASDSHAAVMVYSAYDSAATGPDDKPNSDAARAAFMAAVSGLPQVFTNSFEAAPTGRVSSFDLGGGGSLASTDQTYHPLSIRSAPPCDFSICGGNTTAGGSNFAHMHAGEVVFTFDAPIEAFGAFFTGAQFSGLKLVFDDGSAQAVDVPAYEGASFVGFRDPGRQISEVRFKAPLDYISIDDVTFALSAPGAVPEPAAWALMISGFGFAGGAIRLRRRLEATAL